MGRRDIRNAVNQWIDAWNARDIDGIKASYAEDATLFQTPVRGKVSGRDDIIDQQSSMLEMSSDLEVYLRELYIDGDAAIPEITYAGTNDGRFLGYQPTGKKFQVDTCLILIIKDGKITEHVNYLDSATVLRSLGLLAAPEARPEVA